MCKKEPLTRFFLCAKNKKKQKGYEVVRLQNTYFCLLHTNGCNLSVTKFNFIETYWENVSDILSIDQMSKSRHTDQMKLTPLTRIRSNHTDVRWSYRLKDSYFDYEVDRMILSTLVEADQENPLLVIVNKIRSLNR